MTAPSGSTVTIAPNFNFGRTDFLKTLQNALASSLSGPLAGQSFMHELAREGDVLSAEVMIAAGAKIDKPDDEGRRPLHEAASAGKLEMIELLLRQGALLDAPIAPFGYTALYLAAEKNAHDVVRRLIGLGASLRVKDALSGEGLLHLAAARGDVKMAGILIAAGIDVFAEDKNGQTPRDHAARKGHKSLERTLLKVMQHHAMQGV